VAEEVILIREPNFAKITRVEANRRLFTDVSSKRERQIPKALKVEILGFDDSRWC
jgi:hypothetical protein